MNPSPAARAASLLPVPAALISYRSTDGQARLAPAAWTAIVCRRTATLSAALGAGAEFAGGGFVVNLLPDELLASPTFLEALARRSPPVELVEDGPGGLPRVAGCAARIECADGALRGRTLRGRVVAVDGLEAIFPVDQLICRPRAGRAPVPHLA